MNGLILNVMFWKSRAYWLIIFIAITIGLAIILPFYFQAQQDEKDSLDTIFDITSTIVINDISDQVNSFVSGFFGIATAFGTLGNFTNVTKVKFDKLTNTDTSIFTLSYNPFVYEYERTLYEDHFSAGWNETIVIRRQLSNGTIIVSPTETFYVPVGFANFPTNVQGVDVYQVPDRKVAIDAANNGISTVLTPTVLLGMVDTIIMPIITPVTNIYNDTVAILALVITIDSFFSSVVDTAIDGTKLDTSLILDDQLLYSTKYDTINHIYDNEYVKVLEHVFIDKTIQIIITSNDEFKDKFSRNANDIFLIINMCLLVAVLCLITYLFYANEKSNEIGIKKVQEASKSAYNRMVSYFSHEIRNPLNTVYSMLHYIEPLEAGMHRNISHNEMDSLIIDDENNDDSDDKLFKFTGQHLKMLYNSVYRIKHFVDEMLEFQKMSDGKINLSKYSFNVIDFAKNILEQQSINCDNVIRLQLTVSKQIMAQPIIHSDSIRLSQIILNGLSNAIKFTEKGFIQIRLYILTISDNRYLSVEILNSGIGLGDVNIDNLFVPFGQSSLSKFKSEILFNYDTSKINMQHIDRVINSADCYQFDMYHDNPGEILENSIFAKQAGSGMGMSISRMLSIALGGYLTIYDEYEGSQYKQTNFHSVINVTDSNKHITIPINYDIYEKSVNTSHNRIYSEKFKGMEPSNIQNSDISILIVDDTPDVLRMGQMMFSKLGYNIDAVSDGAFINYNEINNYDIILLDIVMAQSSGLEVCGKLIHKGYTGVILVTSGDVTDNSIKLYNEVGFDGVYGKPFQIRKTNEFFRKMLITHEWDILM